MSDVILIPVEEWGGDAVHFLYQLLGERRPEVNISHKAMPSFEEHEAFVRSKPYSEWWLVATRSSIGEGMKSYSVECVGVCYLTHQNEIGLQISADQQRMGRATAVLRILLERYKERRLIANVSIKNDVSRALFEKFGFVHIQNTFELEAKRSG